MLKIYQTLLEEVKKAVELIKPSFELIKSTFKSSKLSIFSKEVLEYLKREQTCFFVTHGFPEEILIMPCRWSSVY